MNLHDLDEYIGNRRDFILTLADEYKVWTHYAIAKLQYIHRKKRGISHLATIKDYISENKVKKDI
jgi:hypothetical protein